MNATDPHELLSMIRSPAPASGHATTPSRKSGDESTRLYAGRERMLEELMLLSAQSSQGRGVKAAVIEGEAGRGKSTLLRALAERIQRCGSGAPLFNARVLRARCNAGSTGSPFECIARALAPFMQMILASGEDALPTWRAHVRRATTPMCSALSELVPGLREVLAPPIEIDPDTLGDQPSKASRELLLSAFARLIACFASADQPLVLLIDDLHFADPETLALLERLLTRHAQAALALVAATSQSLEDRRRFPTTAPTWMDIAPRVRLGRISAEDARARLAHASPVAEFLLDGLEDPSTLCMGNPLLLELRLRQLASTPECQVGHLLQEWVTETRGAEMPSEARQLHSALRMQLQELPVATRELLGVLACLGGQANVAHLSIAGNVEPAALIRKLAPATVAGLVHQSHGIWALAHGCACDAIYGAAEDGDCTRLHLRIARRLRAAMEQHDEEPSTPGHRTELLFALSAHASLGISACDSNPPEHRSFGVMALAAGRKALLAAAYDKAWDLFCAAINWFAHDPMCPPALEAFQLCAVTTHLLGHSEQAVLRLSELQSRIHGDEARFGMLRLRVAICSASGRDEQALEIALRSLVGTEYALPAVPSDADVDAEFSSVVATLDRHGAAALRNHQLDDDPVRIAAVDLLVELLPPALRSRPQLADLLLLRVLKFGLDVGSSHSSPIAYVGLPRVLGGRYGDAARSAELAEMAVDIAANAGLHRNYARVLHAYASQAVLWTWPPTTAVNLFDRSFEIAMRVGDYDTAIGCGPGRTAGMLFSGQRLDAVRDAVETSRALAVDAGSSASIDALTSALTLLSALQRPVPDQPGTQHTQTTAHDMASGLDRLRSAVIFNEEDAALDAHETAMTGRNLGRPPAELADLAFYGAIALVRSWRRTPERTRALASHLAALNAWSINWPKNFGSRQALVLAEQARIEGRGDTAGRLYTSAVNHARRFGAVHVEALGAELAARFHAGRSDHGQRRLLVRRAVGAWQRWGAHAKALQLQKEFSQDFDGDFNESGTDLDGAPAGTTGLTRAPAVDVAELLEQRVLDLLLAQALERSDADYAAFATQSQGHWTVQARRHRADDPSEVANDTAALCCGALPISVAQLVAKTQQAVHFDEVARPVELARDLYVLSEKPSSILCLPVMRYARFLGVLYVDRRSSAKWFPEDATAALTDIAAKLASALLGEEAATCEEIFDPQMRLDAAQARLQTSLADMGRASQLKAIEELMASIVHEIAQPLSAITAAASAAFRWLNHPVPNVGEALDVVSHIRLSAERARSIVQGLRALTRKTKPKFSQVDLGEALRESVLLVGASLEKLGVTLVVDGPEQAIPVMGDVVQLQQLACNLLMNGAEAMESKRPGERLLTLTWRGGDVEHAVIEIQDRGIGVDPSFLDQLEQPFYTTKPHGMGMGLAICKSILDAHGGTMDFSSRPEGGTVVRLRLPRSPATLPWPVQR